MRSHIVSLVVLLAACRTEGQLIEDTRELSLEVTSPTYGQFLRDAPAQVEGTVFPPEAVLVVEGEEIDVAEDGTFSFPVPVDHAYRIVDVQATFNDQIQKVRVPVFRGSDPLETWPGGLTLRLTPAGLDHLGQGLGAMVDGMGWDQQIADQLPDLDLGFVVFTPTGITHDPTVVELIPATDGLDVQLSFRNVDINYSGTLDIYGTLVPLPVTIGYDEIGLGARATPDVDEAGMLSMTLSEPDLILGQPDITIFGLDGFLLELVADGIGALIEPLVEPLLGGLIDQMGTLELGGPYVFETDLLGTTVEARLSDVFGDLGGLGAGLGLGLGEPAMVGPLGIPTPTSSDADVHAMLGLHEGLMHQALVSGLLDQFTQDLELPGFAGELIGNYVRNLPGGDDAPENADGWCLALAPQPARVVRLQTGIEPFAVLYMPDVVVDIGTVQGSSCETWLKVSLAFEVGIDVRQGTLLTLAMDIPEGAVLEYGAEPGWEEDEAEIVAGLGSFMGTVMDLVGGNFSMDLSDLMGGLGDVTGEDPLMGAFADLDLRIVDSQPMLDGSGAPIEGLYAVSLQLWAPPPAP